MQGLVRAVFQAVNGTRVDIGRLIALEREFLVAIDHRRRTLDHHPMFRPVPVALQGQTPARLDDQTLDLEPRAALDIRERPPGPMHAGMGCDFAPPLGGQAFDQGFDLGRAGAGCDEHGVARGHDT